MATLYNPHTHYAVEVTDEEKEYWIGAGYLTDTPALSDDLTSCTVAELKELAEKQGVDINGLTKKAEIIEALRG